MKIKWQYDKENKRRYVKSGDHFFHNMEKRGIHTK